MISGRRDSDWLPKTSAAQSDERRGADRRAPRRPIDPLFAATLVNQIAPAEEPCALLYPKARPLVRPGVVVNVRA
ncbi:MAG: hypothetical protein AB7P07_08690 [Hyphomonadaceae bacterium]